MRSLISSWMVALWLKIASCNSCNDDRYASSLCCRPSIFPFFEINNIFVIFYHDVQ